MDHHVPEQILVQVLGWLPLKNRLQTARVSKRFHAAALAATRSIDLSLDSDQLDGLHVWLQEHGSHLISIRLHVHGAGFRIISLLHCTQLQHISLSGPRVQLGAGAAQQGDLLACPQLTALSLQSCILGAGARELASLSILTSLRGLQLQHVESADDAVFPAALLSQLVGLTKLQLAGIILQSSDVLQHLSCVTDVQHLWLEFTPPMRLTAQQALSGATALQSLSKLTSITLIAPRAECTMQNMPGLSKLTRLDDLRMSCSILQPSILEGCRNLKALRINASWADSTAVLAAVGGMQRLTDLTLTGNPVWFCPSAAAYTALTASSGLRKLCLVQAELPVGAWQHMFAGSRAPKLEYFRHDLAWQMPQGVSAADIHSLHGAADAQHLACCTALQELSITLQPGAVPVPLQQLQALTSLTIGGVEDAAAGCIAQLTCLVQLYIGNGSDRWLAELTPAGLLQLTTLRALTHLCVLAAENSAAAPVMVEGHMVLFNQVRLGPCTAGTVCRAPGGH